MPTFKRPEDAGDGLTVLLLRAVPPNDRGKKTLTELSRIIRVSKQGIRKWIRKQKISPERAMQIVAISEGRVQIEDFHPYVYKD
jgi:hypothetical protein